MFNPESISKHSGVLPGIRTVNGSPKSCQVKSRLNIFKITKDVIWLNNTKMLNLFIDSMEVYCRIIFVLEVNAKSTKCIRVGVINWCVTRLAYHKYTLNTAFLHIYIL